MIKKDNKILELEKEISRLKSSVNELKILNEIALFSGRATDIDQILNLIVQKSVNAISAEQGSILLVTPNKEEPLITIIRQDDTSSLKHNYHIGKNITGWVLLNKEPIIIENLQKDKRFKPSEKEIKDIHSVLSVPIWYEGNIIGIMMLINKKNQRSFSQNDLTFISIISIQTGQLISNLRLQKETLQKEIETEKLQELDKIKTNFFTNISHELRTPLTLIQGPAKHIFQESEEIKTRDGAKIIYRNALKLNRLVNQLLDLSKLEAGKMSIRASETNVIDFVKDIVLSFTPLAEKKRITLNLNYDNDNILAFFDKDKMNKILNNVLSNAFKFTPNGGNINVSAGRNEKTFLIKISDTGIGIPKERINKIFDRFYQVDDTQTRKSEGTGIGLALTKELIELHGGSIEVESKEGEGSTFIITIPLGKEHLKPDQIIKIKEDEENSSSLEKEYLALYETEHNEIDLESLIKNEKPVLLIVEDNQDVRFFIKNIFEDEYKILEANNGEEGLRIVFNEIPDLIITDLMMPKLDGFEMCSKIKNDERSSHIPVIMLTAKATKKDVIEGFETGADDYVMKPFDSDVLKARVKNLFDQRKRLREQFIKYGLIKEDLKQITKIDKIFLDKIIQIISDHLADTGLSVEFLASEIAMSRVTLHKKLNSLIGESPSDLIKRIRLNRAAKYLQNNHGNISEIAIEVGFNNPAYFAECFKQQFGISPSQYQHKFINN